MAEIQSAKFETQELVLRCDQELEESQQTKWEVMPLTMEYKAEIGNEARRDRAIPAALTCFRYGVIGWKNLTANGEPVQFEGIEYRDGYSRVHPKFLTESAKNKKQIVIPFAWQMEIGERILELSFLTDIEKN